MVTLLEKPTIFIPPAGSVHYYRWLLLVAAIAVVWWQKSTSHVHRNSVSTAQAAYRWQGFHRVG